MARTRLKWMMVFVMAVAFLALFDELRREGWRDEELGRIQSPIGLDIGAESPEEIAIAIVAELIQIRRSQKAS